ncbi:MAG: RagB/SusD family nutrient uptake outer membrane protein [Bacteroidota bacterium]
MKTNLKTYKWIMPLALVVVISSCKKFIEEDLVTTLTEEYYKTDAGLEDLVKSAYAPLQWKFSGEQSYGMYNFGTDEFREGDQFNNVRYNDYDANLNSNDAFVNGLWINNYSGIRRCNQGIEMIAAFENPASKILATPAQKDLRISELKALRAFYYLQLVQQLGGVPLVISVPKSAEYEFPRASVADVYAQIIKDFKEAGPLLPWRYVGADRGRATRAMAYHFLAKAYFTRGSAVKDARGQQGTDMDNAILYADSVVTNSGHALEANYGNLFSAAFPDGRIPALGENGSAPTGSKATLDANNASNEIIYAAQFSANLSLATATNNQTHLFYPSQYDAGIPGMTRDFFNGRPFRRLAPTDYTIDIFNKVNDSRFFKSFQTVFHRNVASNTGLPVFTVANAPNPSLVGKVRVGIGDTAALYIVNSMSMPVPAATIAAMRFNSVYARYRQTGTAITSDYSNNKYLTLWKFADPIRLTTTNNEARGIRNGTFARLAETYLILAEAYGRKGDYSKALEYVNVLRTRSAYKAGEARSPQIWQFLGGPNNLESTITNNLATMELFTTNASSELYPSTVTGTEQRFIHFMLNERTRELCGEFYRWEDLARTETLFERTKLFNLDISGSFAEYHKLRPIPYLQMIAQTINGNPYSEADMKSYQNPGY